MIAPAPENPSQVLQTPEHAASLSSTFSQRSHSASPTYLWHSETGLGDSHPTACCNVQLDVAHHETSHGNTVKLPIQWFSRSHLVRAAESLCTRELHIPRILPCPAVPRCVKFRIPPRLETEPGDASIIRDKLRKSSEFGFRNGGSRANACPRCHKL